MKTTARDQKRPKNAARQPDRAAVNQAPSKRSTAAPAVDLPVDPAIAPTTEGQRLLMAVPETHAAVGAAVGASKQSVSQWRRGEKVPGEGMRAKLRDAYRIDPVSWGKPAGAAGAKAPPPASPPQGSAERTTTLEACDAHLAEIDKMLAKDELLASDRAKLLSAKTQVLRLRATIEEKGELFEDRAVREHPFYRRMKGAILGALRAHPDAARAVADALAELDQAG